MNAQNRCLTLERARRSRDAPQNAAPLFFTGVTE
jgi:hypothetical protein